MSNRFVLPLETPVDATGAPYPGGKLFFYQSGTSTKLDTFSNSALTIANTNPVILDSAGRFPNAIFLQNQPYSVVLSPSTDSDPPTSPIWTQDPVYTSDFSTAAQFTSGSGSPNGSVAGTAGSATIKASAYWDFTNNILYICTTTGTATTAVWTAVNASSAAAVVPPPQGYLTPVSGTPIITSDATAVTAVYYTPYIGLLVPIYNGTSFVPTSIVSELQLTLVSSHAASNIYDFYIFNLSGVPTLGTGPSWSAGSGGSIAAGSCARGTGSGGAALARLQGINTNAVSMTMRYGNGTTTMVVAPNQGTYVGTLFIDTTNGQVTCNRSYGQSRKWGIWNAYNRTPTYLKAGDSATSWSVTSATFGAQHSNTANSLTVLVGLQEERLDLDFHYTGTISALPATNPFDVNAGVGYNSTTSPVVTAHAQRQLGTSTLTTVDSVNARYVTLPTIGINAVTMLEASNASITTTVLGGEASNCLTATWLA